LTKIIFYANVSTCTLINLFKKILGEIMSSKISVRPVNQKNISAQKMLEAAKTNSKEAVFSIHVGEDMVRVKNICADVTTGFNGTTKHIPFSLTHDFAPGQKFSVDKVPFEVVKL